MLFNIAPTQTHKQTNFKLANVDAGPMTKAPFKLTKHDQLNRVSQNEISDRNWKTDFHTIKLNLGSIL